MPRRIVLILLSFIAIGGCAHVSGTTAAHGRFEAREVEVAGQRRRYRVFVPAAKRAGKPPVILFLHGSGERGSDNLAQLDAGIGPYLRRHMDDFPAIVVLPQAPEGGEWLGDNNRVALAALDAATREFGGDPKRTYLTGLSMGGYGVWNLALDEPTRFAALAPICGALHPPRAERPTLLVSAVANEADPYAALAARLRHVPAWIFHGARDDVVLPDDDRRAYAALKAAGAEVRYTEFPDANHNSWDPAYAMPELWTWLFAQELPR
ncbi:MAG: alpha/beta hydrolase-fold protein [Pseudoxanthomonas sp.]